MKHETARRSRGVDVFGQRPERGLFGVLGGYTVTQSAFYLENIGCMLAPLAIKRYGFSEDFSELGELSIGRF
jgi:hypothetical protein